MRSLGWTILLVLIGVSPAMAQNNAADPFGPGSGSPNPFGNPSTSQPVNAVHTSSQKSSPAGASSLRKQLPERPKVDVKWLSSTSELDQAVRQKMFAETKLQFINTPFGEVLGYLEQLHHLQFVPSRELEDQIDSDEFTVTMNIEGIPLDSAFDFLTESRQLGWYIEGGMVMITTADEADRRMSSRMYSLNGQVNVIEAIQESLEPDSWKVNGGEGTLWLLPDGKLIVWQNRRGHEQVEALIAALNESLKKKD